MVDPSAAKTAIASRTVRFGQDSELAAELGRKTAHQEEAKGALAYIRSESDTVIPNGDCHTTTGLVCDAHEDFA